MAMGCQVMIESWTFPRLVGAFLNLFIAYCLLCCSAFAFFLSKSLAFFGFTLPCPSHALFSPSFLKPNFPWDSNSLSDPSRSSSQLVNFHGSEHVANGVAENAIRILELALEEEQAARDELWSELEQERLAAATAADEAMAMISRLQEEKASLEIEARQFRRILEEKSAYDAEEMDILKEIIVRREREKYSLEKEVEAYRRMFKANSECDSDDPPEQNDNSCLDFLQKLSESIDKRRSFENLNNYPDLTSVDVDKRSCIVSDSKESSIPNWDHKTKTSIIPDELQSDDEVYQDIQEKGVLSVNDVPYTHLCETRSSQGHNNSMFDTLKSDYEEPHVHDVHILDPSWSCSDKSLKIELESNRSSSDTVARFPTDVDNERLRIESEIGWLTERLRAVQEEKKRLKSSMDVASQLQEIHHIAPQQAVRRQTSLPPLSSKVMSRKRGVRSASLGVGRGE